MAGPLDGLRVVELAGIGPGPFTGMVLADMGAEVITVERPGGNPAAWIGHQVLFRSRRSVAVDLRSAEGVEVVLRLTDTADAVFEGFRPGVAERMGVGPEVACARNARLVYGRMTGWGQDGPLAAAAGHDINYIALAGVLDAIGEPGRKPVVPLNLIGDFGGGGMLLAFGMVCALLKAQRTGRGQVVDAAMVDGASTLMAMSFGLRSQGLLPAERGQGLLDGGAPFYDTYRTADDRWIALGALEPHFFAQLREALGLAEDPRMAAQMDLATWPSQREAITEAVAGRTMAEWDAALSGTDVCYAPVLTLAESAEHPHNAARAVHTDVGGILQPSPAPRFSLDHPDPPRPEVPVGADTTAVLAEVGLTGAEIEGLLDSGAVVQA